MLKYDKFYCYVSYEGMPEMQIPEQVDAFVSVKGNKVSARDLPSLVRIEASP